MLKNVHMSCYQWFFVTIFALMPFFVPSLNAEAATQVKADHQSDEIGFVSVGFYNDRRGYYHRPYRYRAYPRYRYRYDYYPYYRNYYYPYYYDYDYYYFDRYPRRGSGIYFHVR